MQTKKNPLNTQSLQVLVPQKSWFAPVHQTDSNDCQKPRLPISVAGFSTLPKDHLRRIERRRYIRIRNLGIRLRHDVCRAMAVPNAIVIRIHCSATLFAPKWQKTTMSSALESTLKNATDLHRRVLGQWCSACHCILRL